MSLLVTGSVAFDTLHTPAGLRENCLGGTAVYFSLGASLFHPVKLVAVVGEDFDDAIADRAFSGRDIDSAGLEKRIGSKTFRWAGRYEGAMNEAVTLETQLGVLAERGPVVPEPFRSASHIFLANSHPVLQQDLLASLANPQLVVCDSMNLWIQHERDELVKLLGKVHGVVVNDGEARLLTGKPNLVSAGRDMLAMGPRFVIIKKGEHGALILLDDNTSEVQVAALPALPTADVVDPTGAGDSFAGGVCGYLAERGLTEPTLADLVRACAYGTCVASFTIQDFSIDALKAADRTAIEHRLGRFRRMLTV